MVRAPALPINGGPHLSDEDVERLYRRLDLLVDTAVSLKEDFIGRLRDIPVSHRWEILQAIANGDADGLILLSSAIATSAALREQQITVGV